MAITLPSFNKRIIITVLWHETKLSRIHASGACRMTLAFHRADGIGEDLPVCDSALDAPYT